MTINSQASSLALSTDKEPPPISETRGCHLRLNPMVGFFDFSRLARQLQRKGFNLMVIDGLYDGYTVYPSERMKERGLPKIHPNFKRSRDLFHRAVEQARELGFMVYVRAEMLKVQARSPHRPHPILARYSDWSVRGLNREMVVSNGQQPCHYICPTNQTVRVFTGDLLYEMLAGIPASGLILSEIGFPPGSLDKRTAACFCESCRTQVNSALAIDLISAKLEEDSINYKRWTEWREHCIDRMLKSWKMRLRKGQPRMLVGAEIPGGFLGEDQASGQLIDWRNWTAKRLVDFITPYYPAIQKDEPWADLRENLPSLPSGAIALPELEAQSEEALPEGIEICREHPLAGFIINIPWPESRELTPALEHLELSGNAQVVEADPLAAALQLLQATAELLPQRHDLRFFLSDVSRLLDKQEPSVKSDEMFENIVNNFAGLRRMIEDRRLPLPKNVTSIGRNMSLIQRLLELVATGWVGESEWEQAETS